MKNYLILKIKYGQNSSTQKEIDPGHTMIYVDFDPSNDFLEFATFIWIHPLGLYTFQKVKKKHSTHFMGTGLVLILGLGSEYHYSHQYTSIFLF